MKPSHAVGELECNLPSRGGDLNGFLRVGLMQSVRGDLVFQFQDAISSFLAERLPCGWLCLPRLSVVGEGICFEGWWRWCGLLICCSRIFGSEMEGDASRVRRGICQATIEHFFLFWRHCA